MSFILPLVRWFRNIEMLMDCSSTSFKNHYFFLNSISVKHLHINWNMEYILLYSFSASNTFSSKVFIVIIIMNFFDTYGGNKELLGDLIWEYIWRLRVYLIVFLRKNYNILVILIEEHFIIIFLSTAYYSVQSEQERTHMEARGFIWTRFVKK